VLAVFLLGSPLSCMSNSNRGEGCISPVFSCGYVEVEVGNVLKLSPAADTCRHFVTLVLSYPYKNMALALYTVEDSLSCIT
jgi:hypothetical protein